MGSQDVPARRRFRHGTVVAFPVGQQLIKHGILVLRVGPGTRVRDVPATDLSGDREVELGTEFGHIQVALPALDVVPADPCAVGPVHVQAMLGVPLPVHNRQLPHGVASCLSCLVRWRSDELLVADRRSPTPQPSIHS